MIVVSGLAPRWAAKRPQNQAPSIHLEERIGRIRAASRPSAGQARSLQIETLQRKRRQIQLARAPHTPLGKRLPQRRRMLEAMP